MLNTAAHELSLPDMVMQHATNSHGVSPHTNAEHQQLAVRPCMFSAVRVSICHASKLALALLLSVVFWAAPVGHSAMLPGCQPPGRTSSGSQVYALDPWHGSVLAFQVQCYKLHHAQQLSTFLMDLTVSF